MARSTPPYLWQLVAACIQPGARRLIALAVCAITCSGGSFAAYGQVYEPAAIHTESIMNEGAGPVELHAYGFDDCAFPSFGWQFKSGPSFTLGDGYFKDNSRVGYQIAFGIREPFLPNDRRFFFDFGGSYLSAFGQEEPFTVEGSIEGGVLGRRTLENFFDMSLSELSRASAQVAFGWYFDVVDCDVCRSRFAARIGGRLSHVRGHFDEIVTDELQAEIDRSNAAGENFVLEKDSPFGMTDTSPGIFGGIEMAVDRRVSRTVSVSFLVDGEIANDWVHLEDLANRGLPTASLMFGINVSR